MDLSDNERMRVLVIGAGRTGARVIQQLRKNPEITIITADPREESYAVKEEIIASVDITEALTPLTFEKVLAEARPDLILVAMPAEDMGLGTAAGIDVLAEAIHTEIAAISNVPVVIVERKPA